MAAAIITLPASNHRFECSLEITIGGHAIRWKFKLRRYANDQNGLAVAVRGKANK